MSDDANNQVVGKGGISMLRGGTALSNSNVDAKGLSMKLAVIPPGACDSRPSPHRFRDDDLYARGTRAA